MKFIQVITTTPNRAQARRLARALVEQKLAACVQIVGPIESVYRWKGKIEKAREFICYIKTARQMFSKLEKAIKKYHPYETPEIIALPIVASSKDYVQWLRKETQVR